MLAAGFLGGAYVTVAHEAHIEWSLFGLCAFALLVGVVLTEMLRRAEAADDSRGADIEVLDGCLTKLIERLENLNAERAGADDGEVFEVRHRIDGDLMEDLDRFVERRESMIGRFGLQTYAGVMSAFAASERLINRTWSASADGYVDEVRTCLAQAEAEMRSAQSQLRAARKPA
jgi:hypothetical protein